MIEILSPTQLRRARETGALVADILQALRSRSVVGTNLHDIDRWAQAMIVDAGALSCYVDYEPSFGRGPFGHYICTSVNDAVLHGKPYDYELADGDLLSLDLAVSHGGVVADSAISFIPGESEAMQGVESLAMISATERALSAGIAAAGPGAHIGDISHAIGGALRDSGYSINTEFGGHGLGSTMHQDPHVPNTGRPSRGYRLRPGLLLALEPWVMADTAELVTDADGWTLRSATGCRTAHSEHTIAITDDGAEILTVPTQPRS
ncbi:MAG: type I methionyl aminopeptidase [Terracoccus sp.]